MALLRSCSAEQSYLSRALGLDRHLEIDYQALPLRVGDVLLLATDGIFDALEDAQLPALASGDDLDRAAAGIVQAAFDGGSGDNGNGTGK